MLNHISALVESVESSSEWRANKAAQYPDDKRNVTSAESLARLAKRLAALPANDGHAVAYEEAMEAAIEVEESILADISTFETRYIGRYGFDSPEDGNPVEFLAELTDFCQEKVDEAKESIAEAEEERRFEEAKEAADEAAKEAAHEAADEAAEEAAKEAAEEAAKEVYREVYEQTYREIYDDTYRDALINALAVQAANRC